MLASPRYFESLSRVKTVGGLAALRAKSILITGATGLIGSNVADMLLYASCELGVENDIFLAGRSEARTAESFRYWEGHYTFLPYDATAPLSFSRPFDFVIHCASNAHPVAYATEPVETILANVEGVRNLLDLLQRSGGGRLLYVSSSEVYGSRVGMELYGEDDYCFVDILNPRACYPNSKRLAETMCAAYREEYGVDFAVVRPGHVYGPTARSSDSRAHAQFARNALHGEDIVLKSEGAQLRSYCYVADCATAILQVMLNAPSGEAYNISNPNSVVTIRVLAKAFADAGGVGLTFDLPSELERKGANMMSCSALDGSKLLELGWAPVYDAQRGAAETLAIMREAGL